MTNTNSQSQINEQIHSFKSIDSITDPNEVVGYPTEFLNSSDFLGLPIDSITDPNEVIGYPTEFLN